VDGDARLPRFTVLLKNNGAADLWLKSEVKMEWGNEFRCALAGDALHAGVLKLAKGEIVPCLIEVRNRLGDARAEGSMPHWQVKFTATNMEGTESTIVSQINTPDYFSVAEAVIKDVPGPVAKPLRD
jgi:hypothetical protein